MKTTEDLATYHAKLSTELADAFAELGAVEEELAATALVKALTDAEVEGYDLAGVEPPRGPARRRAAEALQANRLHRIAVLRAACEGLQGELASRGVMVV